MCTSLKKFNHPFLNLNQGLGLPWSSSSLFFCFLFFFDNVIALVQLIHNAKN